MTIATLGHTIWNVVLILLRILFIFLGAALVLFLLAVINPIVYESAGRANDSDITLRGTVRWFFGAVKLQIGLKEKKLKLVLKFFSFTLFRKSTSLGESEKTAGSPDEEETGENRENSDNNRSSDEESSFIHKKENLRENSSLSEEDEKTAVNSSPSDENEKTAVKCDISKTEKTKKKAKKKAKERKTPEDKKRSSKISEIRNLWSQWKKEENQKTIRLLKKTLFGILKHAKPKTFRLHGVVGTDDPAVTGWILALFYLGYPAYGASGDFRLSADFDKKTLKGKYYVKGRVIPAVPLGYGLRLLMDRNIRRLIFH